ncbi:MAG: flagellar motor switch protein FliG [Spirochaetaceae bacterium]|nr:flagellar motor switch protein FliG [Spirochaetaceae bacterium]
MRAAGAGEPPDAAPGGHLTGQQKAAVILVLLGTDLAARIFEHLDEHEIEQLSLAIAQLGQIAPAQQDAALAEFQKLMLTRGANRGGGLDYARDVLEKSLGAERAVAMIGRVTRALHARPFGFVRRSDSGQVLASIRGEHPQTIALVLAYLKPDDAAALLASLPYTVQADVARRVATLEQTIPEVVVEVERVLQRRLARVSRVSRKRTDNAYVVSGGNRRVLKILHHLDRATERTIIDAIGDEDPALSDELKQQMFAFEDLWLLDDGSLRRVLRAVSRNDLAAALKAVDQDMAERVTRAMSKRGAALLQDAMRALGNIRLGAVEAAQQRVAATIRELEQGGEITLGSHSAHGDSDR